MVEEPPELAGGFIAPNEYSVAPGGGTVLSAVSLTAANIFTGPQTIADPNVGDTGLTLQQPKGATVHQLVIKGDPAAEKFVVFTLSGEPNVGPYYHFNKFGLGIVGNAEATPAPYFAIESSAAFDGVFKIKMGTAAENYNVGLGTKSETKAKSPSLTVYAAGGLVLEAMGVEAGKESNITLKPSSLSTEATNGYVLIKASRGLAVQNQAGSKNLFVADPNKGVGTGKIGFYAIGPVEQPKTTGTAAGVTLTGVTITEQLEKSTFTGNSGETAYTISDVILALKQLGLLKA